MDIASSFSTNPKAAQAASAAYEGVVDKLGGKPDFLVLAATASYDLDAVAARLKALAPGVPLHGSTSANAVMTEQGYHSGQTMALGLLGLRDGGGAYGVGSAELGDQPRAAGAAAVSHALEQAGRPGELPPIIWISGAPGNEEEVIAGVQDVVGAQVPILGGSSADDLMHGDWRQLANGQVFANATVVSVLFPSTPILFAFHSGYEPTSTTGVATHVDGRTLVTIDDRPAAQVYDEWIGGKLPALNREEDVSILADAPLWAPLGRPVTAGTNPLPDSYLLAHPESVTADGGLRLLAEVEVGETLVLMQGSTENLIARPGRVVDSAMEIQGVDVSDIVGGLVIYCAGCMRAVAQRSEEVVDSINDALEGRPFLGSFTFGEQGCFFGGENRHGNLMSSVLLFRRAGPNSPLDR